MKEVRSNIPVDLNFDGINNTDLSKEFPLDSCSIYVENTGTNPIIDITWLEPQFNDSTFFKSFPDTLAESTRVRYLPASQKYYYTLSDNKSEIIKGPKWVSDDRVYSFRFPDTLYKKDGFLEFTSEQDVFVSKKKHMVISISAMFQEK